MMPPALWRIGAGEARVTLPRLIRRHILPAARTETGTPMRIILASAVSFLAATAALAQGAASGGAEVKLAPHRAVYDLSLVRSSGPRGIENAKGRIAMDFGGDACDGYTLNYRQVTVLDGAETGSRTIDSRTATYESADGGSMTFKSESSVGGRSSDNVDGEARVTPTGDLAVTFKGKKDDRFEAGGHPLFPTEHLKKLIEAGRAGKNTLSTKVYDGSDGGKKVYDTLAIIGRRIEPGAGNVEQPARQGALANLARWPVAISYYNAGSADQTPAYTIAFDLFENGVSRSLRLDYGDFALRGELKTLEVSAVADCRK
jgi:hypothetical protein